MLHGRLCLEVHRRLNLLPRLLHQLRLVFLDQTFQEEVVKEINGVAHPRRLPVASLWTFAEQVSERERERERESKQSVSRPAGTQDRPSLPLKR